MYVCIYGWMDASRVCTYVHVAYGGHVCLSDCLDVCMHACTCCVHASYGDCMNVCMYG
jgi:hypothetical protein